MRLYYFSKLYEGQCNITCFLHTEINYFLLVKREVSLGYDFGQSDMQPFMRSITGICDYSSAYYLPPCSKVNRKTFFCEKILLVFVFVHSETFK